MGAILLYLIILFIRSAIARAVELKKNKEYYTKVWREQIVPGFRDHTHKNPHEVFLRAEEYLFEGFFTEVQIGISLDELLKHALTCQKKLIVEAQHGLHLEELRLEDQRLDVGLSPRLWEETLRSTLSGITGWRNMIATGEKRYAELEARWKKIVTDQPQLVLKLA